MNCLNNLPVWLLLTASILLTIIGDFYAKYWGLHSSRASLYWMAMICWTAANLFFIPSLLKKSLVYSALIFTLANIVGFSLVGLVIFKESISNTQVVGILLGIISLILISLG